jgi:hypothetical protein
MSRVGFRRIGGKLGPGGSRVAAKAYSVSSSIRPELPELDFWTDAAVKPTDRTNHPF